MAQQNPDVLIRFVSAYRRKIIVGRIGRMLFIVGALFFGLFALLQLFFSLFPWVLLPFVFDIACAGAVGFWVVYLISQLTWHSPGLLAVGRAIERRGSVRRPLLSLALELAADRRTRDNPFTGQAAALAAAELKNYPQSPRWPASIEKWGAAAMVFGFWCFLNPFLSPRLLDYWELPITGIARPALVVWPGTVVVPMNVPVRLGCRPEKSRYPSCRLAITGADGERVSSLLLRPDSAGAFAYTLESVKKSFSYRFSLGAEAGRPETVTVVPPPRLHRVNVALQPPAYTRKPGRALPEGQGNFDAYAGSRARVSIESTPLRRAWLLRGRDSLPLAVQGSRAEGEMRVAAAGNYTFALEDTLGQRSDSLPVFTVNCIPDEPPSVQIVRPGFNKDLQPEQVETLAVEGVDDIGIRALSLEWRLGGDRAANRGSRDLTAPGAAPLIRTAFVWRLTALSLYPGDTVFYWARIVDNRPSATPQTACSDTFWFRIPGFEEIHRMMAQKEERAEQALGAVRDRQGDMQRQLESVVRAANRKQELTWEQKQILRDVREEIQKARDSLGSALKDLQENVEKMKQEGTAGEELSQKFDKVRKAVDDLIKQYGDSLLFNMKDVEKPLSWQEMRDAIQKVAQKLPRLGEELDEVLKFLEMLKQDRKLAELAMRAEQLSKEQASLARSESAETRNAERQKELLEQIRRLSKDAQESMAGDSGGAGMEDSLRSQERLDSLGKAMQSSMNQAQMPGRETMNQMSGALLSMSQELMQMMNFNMGMRMEKERQQLLALSRDALSLADWQNELLSDPAAPGDPAAAGRAQQALKDALKKSMASANNLSMLPPDEMVALGRAYREALESSERVIGELASSDGRGAMSQSGEKLRGLANSLLGALSNMGNGQQSPCSGGACMMPGLRRLSGRQAMINSATAQMLRSMMDGLQGQSAQTGNGNAQGMDEARRAAQKAQSEIAEELKKLSEKYGREAGEGMNGKVKDLEEEARRLAALLERPAPQVTERQDRFLARMLETTLSMHKEGEGKDEWKSRTAESVFSSEGVAAPGDFFRDVDTFHRLRQKAFQGNFPEGYRNALRQYFDALSEKYLK